MAGEPITVQEILRILQEEGLSKEQADQFSTWAAYMVGNSVKIAEEAKASIYDAISGRESEAVIRAAEQARTLARNLTETEVRKVAKSVADGLRDGLHPDEVARNLDAVKGLDAQRAARYQKYVEWLEEQDLTDAQIERMSEREFERLLRERREHIANTETNNAMSAARHAEAESDNAIGKYWITTGDNRVSPGCRTNEADGVIRMKDEFTSGHQHTPRFPGCRCSIGYVYDEAQKTKAISEVEDRIANTESAFAA